MRLGPRNSRDFWGRCVSEGNKLMTTVTKEQLQELLTQLPPNAKIELETKPNGEFDVDIMVQEAVVNGNHQTKDDILREEYSELLGKPISATKAAKKYRVHRRTIHKWREKGYINVLEDDGYKLSLNEADIAYCSDILHQKKLSGMGYRGPLLDEDGLPYQLKHPSLSRYRRQKKQDE